jgi:nitrogen fixation-related uncharacterized protein
MKRWHPFKSVCFVIPVSIALWCVILMAVGVWRV